MDQNVNGRRIKFMEDNKIDYLHDLSVRDLKGMQKALTMKKKIDEINCFGSLKCIIQRI